MKKLLFDASSFIHALKIGRIDLLIDNYIQWLTIYEVLNGLWKEVYLVKTLTLEEVEKLNQVIIEIMSYMNILSPRGFEKEILETAIKLGITVYDSSYIVLAQKHGLILVTEDKELRDKAKKLVEVKNILDIIKRT